jgi:Uma2 family endonuclease
LGNCAESYPTTEKDKKRARETKLKLYSVQGVSEYWIGDSEAQIANNY